MAKDPAFLFYPGDWQLGTMHMNLLEKGCYIELLMLQFSRGKFTLAHAKHMLNGSFDVVWPCVSEKFETDGSFYWNRRLEEEKEKRKNFVESRRSNGFNKKETPKDKKAYAKHMHTHTEDENKDENESINKAGNAKKSAKPKIDGEWQKWLDEWFSFYEKRVGVNPKFDGGQASALKSIKSHLESVSTGLPLDAWKYILTNWHKQDEWMQGQLDLKIINSKFNNVLNNLKNGTGKKPTGGQTSLQSIADKIAAMPD